MRRGENRVKTGVKSGVKTALKAAEDRVKTGECKTPTPPRFSPSLEVGRHLDCRRLGHARVYFERAPSPGPRSEDGSPTIGRYIVTPAGSAAPDRCPRVHRGFTAQSTISTGLLRRSLGCCGLERGRRVFRSALTPPGTRRCTAASSSAAATAGDPISLPLRRSIGSCGLECGRRVVSSALTPARTRCRAAFPFTGAAAGDLFTWGSQEHASAQPLSANRLSWPPSYKPLRKSMPDSRTPGRAAGPPPSPANGETHAYCH